MMDEERRHRWALELEQIRAEIDQSIVETARTRQMMKWQPWLVLAGYVVALVAVFSIGSK